jgi:eukaryotic-like serine/threonine-protein kinase
VTNEDSAARFEHEVQMTSQLTHPNTVAVFDYGRTPEGLFYYAMEYLSGIDLNRLVRQFGPQLEGRVIHILRQVCGSLTEAHGVGLIHRDIKPANIVLTRRGGLCDVVKVLDFGLVKAMQPGPSNGAASAPVVGTPHFMSPEAVDQPATVDGRSDLYSLGAVAYWLLTGQPLFGDRDVEAVLRDQVRAEPVSPSVRSGRPISVDLENLVMRCLAKIPEQRPPSAEALDKELAACRAAGDWTMIEAETWWQANQVRFEAAPKVAMAEKTLVIAPRT